MRIDIYHYIETSNGFDLLASIVESYTFVDPDNCLPGIVFESYIIRLDSLIIPLQLTQGQTLYVPKIRISWKQFKSFAIALDSSFKISLLEKFIALFLPAPCNSCVI